VFMVDSSEQSIVSHWRSILKHPSCQGMIGIP
jgi:hypothetical protein